MIRLLVAIVFLVGCHHPKERHGSCPATVGRADEMGAILDPLSALRPSEVLTQVDVSRTHQGGTYLGSTAVALRYGGESLTGTIGYGAAMHGLHAIELGPVELSPSNIIAGIGYRRRDSQLGGAYRRGIAFRTEVSIDVYDDRTVQASDFALTQRRPFEMLRFTAGQYFQSMLEVRYELIGCHAPFIHLSGGLRARKDVEPSTVAVPLAVSIGAHPGPWGTITGEYAVLIGRAPTIESDITLQSRLRIGIEWDSRPKFGIEGGITLGPYDSAQLVGTMSIPLDWGYAP